MRRIGPIEFGTVELGRLAEELRRSMLGGLPIRVPVLAIGRVLIIIDSREKPHA